MSKVAIEFISKDLIKLAGDGYCASGTLKTEVLHSLYLIHSQTLVSALDLIDNEKVSVLKSASGRWVYQIIGGTGSFYTCLPNSSFCQCPSFKFSVIKRKDAIFCKHVLAAKLASAMNVINTKTVTDEDMVDILMNLL